MLLGERYHIRGHNCNGRSELIRVFTKIEVGPKNTRFRHEKLDVDRLVVQDIKFWRIIMLIWGSSSVMLDGSFCQVLLDVPIKFSFTSSGRLDSDRSKIIFSWL